ncbi:hypothetical protein G7085_03520 [Tessaracoccus sp. HDW20]|uniref:hypothetical protein n=1 Tax=Tessaracoccus coleopterorum TaxID=2714950 RepID=UPI0018D2F39B|nr:hypothetical protein [Tessaracoccus coleopterorum]NHB84038.1 hypothetical protein [Tessaracoccus coleopterorum]
MTAGRTWRPWTRVVLGLSLPVLAAGTLALQYYPHGSLVALATEAVVLIAAAPAPPCGHPVGSRFRSVASGESPPGAHRGPATPPGGR